MLTALKSWVGAVPRQRWYRRWTLYRSRPAPVCRTSPASRGTGGRGASTWAFEWKGGRKDDAEEEGFRFGDHAFKVGEYVSVREEEGELLTFRVVSVGNP